MGIVGILFRIANFAALVGAGFYVYRYYIKNIIQEAMQKKEHIVVGLQNEHDLVTATYMRCKDKVVQQQDEYMRLQSHIAIWSQAVAEEDRLRSQEREKRIAQMKEKSQHKKEELYRNCVARRVMPYVVDATEKKVKQIFNVDASAGDMGVDNMSIDNMRDRLDAPDSNGSGRNEDRAGIRFLQRIITSLKEN